MQHVVKDIAEECIMIINDMLILKDGDYIRCLT